MYGFFATFISEWITLFSLLFSMHCLYLSPEPLSSVSSLEVHFDLLDLTELTDMSDQELGEVFADSDEENHHEPSTSESSSVPNTS